MLLSCFSGVPEVAGLGPAPRGLCAAFRASSPTGAALGAKGHGKKVHRSRYIDKLPCPRHNSSPSTLSFHCLLDRWGGVKEQFSCQLKRVRHPSLLGFELAVKSLTPNND